MTDASAVVGLSGHQALSKHTRVLVAEVLDAELASAEATVGVCSLAAGSDQLFAEAALRQGVSLEVILPCDDYVSTFNNDEDRDNFERLLAAATQVTRLAFQAPSEEAFMQAGREVVRRSTLLLAVWDGQQAGGLGGTADIVDLARRQGVEVHIIWPEGSSRHDDKPDTAPASG